MTSARYTRLSTLSPLDGPYALANSDVRMVQEPTETRLFRAELSKKCSKNRTILSRSGKGLCFPQCFPQLWKSWGRNRTPFAIPQTGEPATVAQSSHKAAAKPLTLHSSGGYY